MEKNIKQLLQDVEVELQGILGQGDWLSFRFTCAVQATITAIQALKVFF